MKFIGVFTLPKLLIFIALALLSTLTWKWCLTVYDVKALKVFSRLEARVLEYLPAYKSDENYWILENEETRSNLEPYIETAGIGFRNNHQEDTASSFPSTSFGDLWNSKSYLAEINFQFSQPRLLWSNKVSDFSSQFNPLHYGDSVIVNDGPGRISKLHAVSGKVLWSRVFKNPRAGKRGAVVAPGKPDVIYIPDGEYLRAIDYRTGKDFRQFGGGKVFLGDEMIVAPRLWGSDKVVGVTINSKILVVDRHSGEILQTKVLVVSAREKRAGGIPSKYYSPRIWSGFAIDNARGLLFVTTSNPAPVLVGVDRPGKNPLSSSVIAFDLVENEIAWEFQDVEHDLWDLDIAAPPVLSTFSSKEGLADVVIIIGKSGNVFVLDRQSGKSLHAFGHRKVPASLVQGEKSATYQKYSIKPQNLLGDYNTAYWDGSSWQWGFYHPPRIDEPILLKGLHGGAMWAGFAVAGNNILVLVNHDLSQISLKLGGRKSAIEPPECEGCHNGENQPLISNFIGSRDAGDFRHIIENGWQGMPPQGLPSDRIDEIVEFLVTPHQVISLGDNQRGLVVRDTYKKYFEGGNGYPELILIDGVNGSVTYRETFNNLDVPFTLGGTSFLAGRYGAFTGLSDKKVRLYDFERKAVVWEVVLPDVGSGSPIFFEIGQKVVMLVVSTGSATFSQYYPEEKIGGAIYAYEVGVVAP